MRGMKCVIECSNDEQALYEFTASSDDELSIAEGETITVIKIVEDWVLGENSKGQKGVFPANYVKMEE